MRGFNSLTCENEVRACVCVLLYRMERTICTDLSNPNLIVLLSDLYYMTSQHRVFPINGPAVFYFLL